MSFPATNKQLPDHAILDAYNKQAYLGNQYVYALTNTEFTSASEVALWLLKNPAVSASSFPSGYVSLFVNLRKLNVLTASQNAILRFYTGPTFSGSGTPVTPWNVRPANANTSIAVLGTGPTVSANGKLVDFISGAALVQHESSELIIIDPGQSLLVTVQASSTTTFADALLSWYEL